jgi:hypothetical protein
VRPANGAYLLPDVVRIALVAQLRKYLPIDDVGAALRGLERDGVLAEIVKLAEKIDEQATFDLVIEQATANVSLVLDDEALVAAVRHPTAPRAVIVISPGDELRRVVAGFRNRSSSGPLPTERRRGRPRSGADVVPLRRVPST